MITLFRNISEVLTLQGAAHKGGRHIGESDLSIQQNAALLFEKGRIVWVGPNSKVPKEFSKKAVKEIDRRGYTVLPGFVECHTHLIHAGHRAAEFEMRNQGVSYQEISRQGGGIVSTMRNTRKASKAELVSAGQKRVDAFIAQGVSTIESKSGYALDLKGELKMLEASRELKKARIVNTFLGAHALPPEYKSYEEYLDFLAEKVLPQVRKKNLAERVDVFIENGFFPKEASRKYLQKAKDMGFEVIVHADQLSLSGGTDVAVDLKALSGDHLLQISSNEIQALAKSETTAVLLPTADLYMKTKYPNARELIDAGARVALATDFNPGSSPTQNLNLVGLLARLEMKMSLPEVLGAYTVGAAHALKLQDQVGSLEVGKYADILCTTKEWKTLFYSVGESLEGELFIGGKRVFSSTK